MRRPAATALVWPAVILAAVSIGLAAGPLPWRFAGESGLPPPAPAPGPAAAPDPVSLASILRLSPFGRLVRPSAEALPAEETTLGLTLHGVVIAALPGASSAIVSSEAEPARVYLVGDAITDSATLEAVFSDHVVLRVEGNPETLSFPKPGSLPVGGVDALRAPMTRRKGPKPRTTPKNPRTTSKR